MTYHVPSTTRPLRSIIIRNAADLQAYLYAKPAPVPATVRISTMERFDRALRGIILGR